MAVRFSEPVEFVRLFAHHARFRVFEQFIFHPLRDIPNLFSLARADGSLIMRPCELSPSVFRAGKKLVTIGQG